MTFDLLHCMLLSSSILISLIEREKNVQVEAIEVYLSKY